MSLLVLLSLVAVALLSLSSTTLRASRAGGARAEARANARMALQMAIGELQRMAGSDTRITARADLLDETNPALTGVWKSWEGTDHLASGSLAGRPIAPDYSAKKKSADNGGGRFLGWLVSGGLETREFGAASSLASSGPDGSGVTLLGEGTLGASGNQIHVEPTSLNGNKGAFAWWVSGENQKARLPEPYEPEKSNAADWSIFARTHAVADPEVFGLESLLDDPGPAKKVFTRGSAGLIPGASAKPGTGKYFHDLSTSSLGLLTNSATGGWRKDLSLFTENWDSLPRDSLPVFQTLPGRSLMMERPTTRSVQAKSSIFFPWASYRAGNGSPPIYQHGATASWAHLKDWMTFYKNVRASDSGEATINYTAYDISNSGTAFQFLHTVRTVPVVARIHWVFSHRTEVQAAGTGDENLQLQLLVNPVITLWNPYGVTLRCNPVHFIVQRTLPCAFSYKVGRADRRYRCLLKGSESKGFQPLCNQSSFDYVMRQPVVLGPGETQVLSAATEAPVDVDRSSSLELRPGYYPGGGHLFRVKDNGGNPLNLRADDIIRVDVRFDTPYDDISEGVGIYLDMGPINSADRHLAYRMVYTRQMAEDVYPPMSAGELTQPTAGEVAGNPVPFLSTVFGTRLASESHLPARGFLQSSPLVNYTAMGSKSVAETDIAYEYPGVLHPVNSPFDYSFIKHAPGDSRLPNATADDNEGYIVSGFDKSSGLSRVVIAELPMRPVCSLAELQNWDLRYENPIPPYQFNLVGNSSATPIIPPNAVVNPRAPRNNRNLQHDDAYCANHLLFDDWFVSSITQRPETFGRGGETAVEVFEKFIRDERPLDNRAYRAVGAGSEEDREELLETIEDRDSWQRIAAHLEVEGMFNVNSVSVPAWRALLRHARDQRVPYLTESPAGATVALSTEDDHAVSRFPIAGDTEAGTPGTSGDFPESSEFAGYRRFDERILDEFAERIVEQVRERGPFLSLSEFINRQLSSGDLALAGAVQSALNNLGGSGGSIYSELARISRDAGVGLIPEAGKASYAFPEASEGESAFGLPGWTSQADVLRPLAPILTVRDDTFTIRAYGDARDASGEVLATATCEAVVRRTRDYVDPREVADTFESPTLEENRKFGRRFQLVAFRWLHPDEV